MKTYSFIYKVDSETGVIYNPTLRAARKQFEAAKAKGQSAFQIRDAETGNVVVKSSWSEKRVFRTLRGLAVKQHQEQSLKPNVSSAARERLADMGKQGVVALQALIVSFFIKP